MAWEEATEGDGGGARFEGSLGVTAGAQKWHGKRLRRGSEV